MAIDVLTTSVVGLDAVLGGGISSGALVMIVGAPGVGKTVLGSQIIFQAAHQGQRGLILTAFSESHLKLLEHLQSFSFFDAGLIGEQVILLSLNNALLRSENTVANEVVHAIRQTDPHFVLIDGFQGLGIIDEPDGSLRALLRSLSTQLSFLNTTLLLTLAGNIKNQQLYSQFTVADTIINLSLQRAARRHSRFVEIIKQRGLPPLSGQHKFNIDSAGITVFPRLEAYPIPSNHPRPTGRAPFGLPALDELLRGGPNAGTTTILAGASGSGCTSLALHWALVAATPEAQSVYVSFSEYPSELESKAATLQLDLVSALQSGAVHMLRFSPNELDADIVGSRLLPLLTSGRVRRLVIDDVNVLMNALGLRARDFLAALGDHIYGEAITGLFVLEIEPFYNMHLNLTGSPIGLLDENLIVVQKYQVGGSVHRALAVLHMRFSAYDRTLREFVIDDGGIRVLSLEETQAGPLPQVIGSLPPDATSSLQMPAEK